MQQFPAVKTAGCHFEPVAGLTGESWRVTSDGLDLLARLQSTDKARLGVSRRREFTVLQRMRSLRIAPVAYHMGREWLLVEWLPGKVLSTEQFTAEAGNGELAALVALLHRQRPSGYPLDLRQQFERYWQAIDRRHLSPRWLHLQRDFLRQKPPVALKVAPLHMDIHAGNLLRSPHGLQLIDWEYAADGDIALELAALFRGNCWSMSQQQVFLRDYCQNSANISPVTLQRQIARWTPWVDYLMLLWFEVRWQQTKDTRYTEWAAPLRQTLLLE
jgi:thiamine kinase